MSLSLPQTFASKTLLVGSELDENFDAIETKFTNGIVDADINNSAAISIDKLSAQWEHEKIPLKPIGAMPAANTVWALFPIPNDSKGAWTVSHIEWSTTDAGAGTGVVRVEWGAYNTSGAWTIVGSAIATGITIALQAAAAADTGSQGQGTVAVTSLAVGTNRSLALLVTTQDATVNSGANASFVLTVYLKRKISPT